MNIHVDTLEYTNVLVKAGIERAHAEAIAKLQAQSVKDLINHEVVTKDHLRSELGALELKLRDEIRSESAKLREEMRDQGADHRRQMDTLMIQIRSLQLGGAIAAFAIGAVVLLSRLIR
jgi:hypothetical protein